MSGHAACLNFTQWWQEHLKSGSSGITTWPHISQINQGVRCNIGLNSSPRTQYGQRTICSAILSFEPLSAFWPLRPSDIQSYTSHAYTSSRIMIYGRSSMDKLIIYS